MLDALQAGYKNDPELLAASAAFEASQKENDIGLSYLLPTVTGNSKFISSSGVTDLDQNTVTGSNNYTSSNNYRSKSSSVTIRQPLFDMERIALYSQGKIKSIVGQLQYCIDRQSFYERISENYFTLLKLQNEIYLLDKQIDTTNNLIRQLTILFAGGESSLTDIDEAKSKLGVLVSQSIETSSLYRNAQRELNNQIGLWPDDTQHVTSDTLPENYIDNHISYEVLMNEAMKKSPILQNRRAAIDLARANVSQQKAGHLPKISLAGQLSHLDVSESSSDETRNDKTIALTVDIPIYSGGSVTAYSEKAVFLLEKAQFDLDVSNKKISTEIEKNYLNVTTGYEKCKILLSVIKSNERIVLSANKGFKAGTKNLSDILNAEDKLFTSKRDFVNEKIKVLLSFIKLKVIIGEMDDRIMSEIQKSI